MAAETEARFTSVERINHYIRSVPNERDNIIPSNRPPDDWPQQGAIKMNDVKVSLSPFLRDSTRPRGAQVPHGMSLRLLNREQLIFIIWDQYLDKDF